MRFTESELALLKATFGDNEQLLKLLRKVFIPEIDPEAPLGQIIDLWMSLDVENQSPEMALINIKARNTLIKHIEGCLLQVKILSDMKAESEAEKANRLTKNSSK